MPVKKVVLDRGRIRGISREGFSWIDRRFVREGFIEDLPSEAILLYFFLVAVSDERGLSFYADPTISRILKLTPEEISQSRARLAQAGLILHHHPLYQVLPLPPRRPPPPDHTPALPRRGGEPIPLGDLLGPIPQRPQKPASGRSHGGRP